MNSALIVDDEPFLLDMYRDLFDLLGIRVAGAAADGRQAVEMVRGMDPPPTFVLMDQRMPNMDGIAATREILRLRPDARVLFVSADSRAADDALNAGAMGFLVKPFTIGALRRAIADVLE